MYDFIVVGCGLYGAVMANRIKTAGYSCLILEKRDHVAGNAYDEEIAGILVHRYGAHIFHTANDAVWQYLNRFTAFNHYVNSPIANYRGQIYNLPFNMNTFHKMWGVITPQQAEQKIEEQRKKHYTPVPQNLEQQAINLVGIDIFEKLIRGYTEKQWGRPCSQLPPFIINRLPVRFTYDNNYFQDPYQGIPVKGYTQMVKQLVDGVDVELNTDYLQDTARWNSMARKIIYTGPIDAFFDVCLGPLQYRSLRFETEVLDTPNYQGNAVVNYTDETPAYTRIIEHKHFLFGQQPQTVISREYSMAWQPGNEPYYPVNDEENNQLYARYRQLAAQCPQVEFGGRLAEYSYYDMDKVVALALARSKPEKLRESLGQCCK